MSHTNDVIYKRFKERAQKQFSVEILGHHQDYYFFEVGHSFACNYWGAHVFRFYRKLSADQEIVHMIKSAVRGNLNTQKWKIYFFSLQIFFNVLRRRVRFCFFVFESHEILANFGMKWINGLKSTSSRTNKGVSESRIFRSDRGGSTVK